MSAPIRRRRHLWGHIVTGRVVMTGLWADAALVMASSAYNGGEAFVALGEARGQGIALGVAVDVALAVALIGDRALHLEGRSSVWGRAIRIITAGMSLALNCGVPLSQGRLGVAAFHAFLPVLLVLLSEYAQDVTLQFGEIAEEYKAQATQDSAPAPSLAPAPAPAWQPRTVGYQAPPATAHEPVSAQAAPRFSAVRNWSTASAEATGFRPAVVRETVPEPTANGGPPSVPGSVGATAGDRSAERSTGRSAEPSPDRSPLRSADRSAVGGPDRSSAPARTGPRTKPGPKPANRARTDEQILAAARAVAAENGGAPLSTYALKQRFGVGAQRALRLAAQLSAQPAADPAARAATRSQEGTQ